MWGAEGSHAGGSLEKTPSDTAPGHRDEPQPHQDPHTRLGPLGTEQIQGSGATAVRLGLHDEGTGEGDSVVTPGLSAGCSRPLPAGQPKSETQNQQGCVAPTGRHPQAHPHGAERGVIQSQETLRAASQGTGQGKQDLWTPQHQHRQDCISRLLASAFCLHPASPTVMCRRALPQHPPLPGRAGAHGEGAGAQPPPPAWKAGWSCGMKGPRLKLRR